MTNIPSKEIGYVYLSYFTVQIPVLIFIPYQFIYYLEGPCIFQTTQDLASESEDDTFPDETENEIDIDDNTIQDDVKDEDLYYDKDECTMQEYEIMKDNLLLYNHARLISQDNHSKDYLVSIMFSHYDQNNNGNLEADELSEVRI